MTRKQLNQQAMLESVDSFLGRNESNLAVNPVIATIAAILATILTTIRDLKQIQDKTTKGATRTKSEIETALINGILKIGAALRAYATEAKNYELLAIATFTDSDIKRMRDSNLADKARTICEASTPVVGDLSIYQVILKDVETLTANVQEYLLAMPGSRSILNQTKQSTAAIQAKLDEGRLLLKEKLDVHMAPFKSTNATMHGEYKNARIIVDLAATHESSSMPTTGVKIVVVDNVSGDPIKDANVAVKASGGSELTKTVKRTDTQGITVFSLQETGSYEYEVTYGDYAIETGSVVNNAGALTQVTVRMKRSA